jgi:hypothetical protein
VAIAADLVAAGLDDSAVVEPAMQPTDPNSLRADEIRSLFDACCAAIGVATPTKGVAGWQRARDIASAIIASVVTPAEGAAELWPLWDECGAMPGSDPLDMLQLYEEWEGQSETTSLAQRSASSLRLGRSLPMPTGRSLLSRCPRITSRESSEPAT